MSSATGGFGAFFGGMSAILGPEMVLVAFGLACGAAVAACRERSLRADLVLGLVFLAVVLSVWIRADLVPPARFSRWLALIPLLGLAEILRLRAGREDWTVPAIALCASALALFWRADRYGPVLAELRGDWQQPLAFVNRSLYHLGSALALGVILVLMVQVLRRSPLRFRPGVAWTLLGVAALMVVFDFVAPVQQWLLLHGPVMRAG